LVALTFRAGLLLALYGFRTADDHGEVLPDILECGGKLTEIPGGIHGARRNHRVHLGALACRRFGFGDVSIPDKGIAAR